MRELKFRAWHTISKKMVEVTGLEWNTEYPNSEYQYRTMSTLSLDERRARGTVYGNAICLNYEIMQYTGLVDKHGREIYEGDILRMEDATAKVVFWERPPEFGLDYGHNEDKWCEDWNLTDDSDRMEIIGNIYENPELVP